MTTPWIVAFVMLCAVVILLALLVIGLFRRIALVLEQAEERLRTTAGGVVVRGADPGTRLEPFVLRTEDGSLVQSTDLVAERGVFLLLHSACAPCRALAEGLAADDLAANDIRIVAVLDDSEAGRQFAFPAGVEVLYQRDFEATRAFDSNTTPHAFAVDRHGVILSSVVAASPADLYRLLDSHEKGGAAEALPVAADVS